MFLWDDGNINHIALHGISTNEAEEVINNDPLDIKRQFRNGETRFVHLGETLAGRILVVVVTSREADLRVVTAFPADRQARKFYSEQKDASDGEINRDP